MNCPCRAPTLPSNVTQGAASLALGYFVLPFQGAITLAVFPHQKKFYPICNTSGVRSVIMVFDKNDAVRLVARITT